MISCKLTLLSLPGNTYIKLLRSGLEPYTVWLRDERGRVLDDMDKDEASKYFRRFARVSLAVSWLPLRHSVR